MADKYFENEISSLRYMMCVLKINRFIGRGT